MKFALKQFSILFVFLTLSTSFWAQQDAQYSQYMYNTVAVNPAYAGSRGVTSVFLLHRTQWVGLEGAPETNVFTLNKPVSNTPLGYGISVLNDRVGISDHTIISADFSYTIAVSSVFKLSFGLKASAGWLSVDYSRLTIRHPSDIVLSQQNELNQQFSPNVGAGLYLHSDPCA